MARSSRISSLAVGGWYNEIMNAKRRPMVKSERGGELSVNISMTAIRRYARRVAARFQPDKIILFGSYAYGRPHTDSDVDILVVMPARNQIEQAVRIRLAVEAPFPMDLIVRTPHHVQWRLREGDSFLTEVVSKGKVLYEKDHRDVGSKGRSRHHHRPSTQP